MNGQGYRLPDSGRALNPKITHCSISGNGQGWTVQGSGGHDINYLGYAGVLEQIGLEGSQPAIPNFQIADLLGEALTGVMGILALPSSRRSARGRGATSMWR